MFNLETATFAQTLGLAFIVTGLGLAASYGVWQGVGNWRPDPQVRQMVWRSSLVVVLLIWFLTFVKWLVTNEIRLF